MGAQREAGPTGRVVFAGLAGVLGELHGARSRWYSRGREWGRFLFERADRERPVASDRHELKITWAPRQADEDESHALWAIYTFYF